MGQRGFEPRSKRPKRSRMDQATLLSHRGTSSQRRLSFIQLSLEHRAVVSQKSKNKSIKFFTCQQSTCIFLLYFFFIFIFSFNLNFYFYLLSASAYKCYFPYLRDLESFRPLYLPGLQGFLALNKNQDMQEGCWLLLFQL